MRGSQRVVSCEGWSDVLFKPVLGDRDTESPSGVVYLTPTGKATGCGRWVSVILVVCVWYLTYEIESSQISINYTSMDPLEYLKIGMYKSSL